MARYSRAAIIVKPILFAADKSLVASSDLFALQPQHGFLVNAEITQYGLDMCFHHWLGVQLNAEIRSSYRNFL